MSVRPYLGDLVLPFNRATIPGVVHQDSRILVGDVRERLRDLPDASVHCVVTSPPYYGLRDYGTGEWVGGDPACEHRAGNPRRAHTGYTDLDRGAQGSAAASATPMKSHCSRCGAERLDRQIGLEGSVREYVDALVDVFREVWRVLRPDGVVWLNLGDTYASRAAGNGGDTRSSTLTNPQRQHETRVQPSRRRGAPEGFKDKDLIGIPWRVALALQDDGWWLRNDVIWSKPNPVPESVRDRCSRSHEYVFLLTRAARYHYDADAVREPHAPGSVERIEAGFKDRYQDAASGGYRGAYGGPNGEQVNALGRNRRTVWNIATQPFKGAHFAVFPPDLAEPCVLAGTSPMACSVCGTAYKRIVDRRKLYASHSALAGRSPDELEDSGKYADEDRTVNGSRGTVRSGPVVETRTVGFRPGCVCGAPEALKMRPDDMEIIESPAGEGGLGDPSLEVGRGGLARPRDEEGGTTTMTRYEQRQYAAQLVKIGKTWQPLYDQLRDQAGHEAFAHYRRKDRNGARAIPADLLEAWIADGHLDRVTVPSWEPPPPTDCVVLDPFAGAGTVGVVGHWHGRAFIGIELNPDNAALARNRILRDGKPARRPAPPIAVSDDQLNLLA